MLANPRTNLTSYNPPKPEPEPHIRRSVNWSSKNGIKVQLKQDKRSNHNVTLTREGPCASGLSFLPERTVKRTKQSISSSSFSPPPPPTQPICTPAVSTTQSETKSFRVRSWAREAATCGHAFREFACVDELYTIGKRGEGTARKRKRKLRGRGGYI